MKMSIIIPVYNHAKELPVCLQTILSQTLWATLEPQHGEIIIVNDGSTDGVDLVIDNLQLLVRRSGIRFEYIRRDNKGAAVARNVGFDHSTGEYLFFCDADLHLDRTCLEKMSTALQSDQSAAFSYSQFRFGWKTFSCFPFDPKRLKELNYIHTSSLIRRSFFPRFDEQLKKFQDWDLFLTIVERGGRGVFIPEVLFEAVTGGTMSQWLPSFVYRLPWKRVGWSPRLVKKYEDAKAIIIEKHRLTK